MVYGVDERCVSPPSPWMRQHLAYVLSTGKTVMMIKGRSKRGNSYAHTSVLVYMQTNSHAHTQAERDGERDIDKLRERWRQWEREREENGETGIQIDKQTLC